MNFMLVYLVTGGEVIGPGGWAKYLRELASYLVSCNYRVKILCRMGKIYTNVDEISTISQSGNAAFSNPKTVFSLYGLMQHLPNPLSVFLGMIKITKDIEHERGCQKILHIHDLASSLLIAFLVRKFFNLPFVVQIHGFPLKEQYIKLSMAKSSLSSFVWFLTKMWHRIAVKLLQSNDAPIIVNNNEVKSFYESFGIQPNRLRVVASGLNVEKCVKELLSEDEAKARLGMTRLEKYVVIGYIGGLRPEKNIGILVEAFGNILKSSCEVRAKLIIIGDGPLRNSLEKLIGEYELSDHVILTGFVPDAYRLLNAIDIYVLPSLSEGSPFSLIEAMTAGKAIIASDIPAVREIVEDGKETLLFDPHSPEQLKDAILKLYHNPGLRRELGENARKKAKQYDINVVFPKIIEVYRQVLRNRV